MGPATAKARLAPDLLRGELEVVDRDTERLERNVDLLTSRRA
jgi:hypothetical protein